MLRAHVLPRRLLAAVALAALSPLATGCSSGGPGVAGEPLGASRQAVTTYGDWSLYGDGECVTGARAFYQAKFGVTLSATGVQTTDVGSCAYLGACMYWVSSKVEPDAATWVRYAWGTEMPKLYDLVIYPPSGTNDYGHVASVDHMEGTDPSDLTQLYVMDSNYTVSEKKSPAIHTTTVTPYGFYRMKSQRGPFCTPGWGAHLNCGDEAGLHDALAGTLYKCSGLTATVVEACADACVKEPTGTDDHCAAATGTSEPPADADAASADAPAALDGGATDDAASGAPDAREPADAASSADADSGAPGSDLVNANAAQAGGCSVGGGTDGPAQRAHGPWGLALAALGAALARGRRGARRARRAGA